MLKKSIDKSKQLELEDKVDEFLFKKGLPNPRIEPDLVDIENDREKYISIMSKLFKQENLEFKKDFVQKNDLPSWVQLITIDDSLIILNSIFYNNQHEIIKNSSLKKKEYIYIHELTHLKQFNISENSRLIRSMNLPYEEEWRCNSLIEGFAEYIAYQTNKEWFEKNRKEDLSILKKSISKLRNNKIDMQNQPYSNSSFNPEISGFLIYNMLDFKNENDKILNLMLNPLKKGLTIENKQEIINAIKNKELFKIKNYEFYNPKAYIERIQK